MQGWGHDSKRRPETVHLERFKGDPKYAFALGGTNEEIEIIWVPRDERSVVCDEGTRPACAIGKCCGMLFGL